jgi:hypothetical protein
MFASIGFLLTCQAHERLDEKRSTAFGKLAFKIVKKAFEVDKIHGKLTVQQYARYALRGDGPATHATPTPIDSQGSDSTAENYKVRVRCVCPALVTCLTTVSFRNLKAHTSLCTSLRS